MRQFLFVMIATTLLGGFAFADKPHGKPGSHHPSSGGIHVNSYHVTHGKQFAGGWYYPGKHHNHWTYQAYWPKYGCTCYWCPSTNCYYYWYEQASCYYPISYIASAPPAFVKLQVTAAVPPAGIPALPD
jgi:hypothetical protein